MGSQIRINLSKKIAAALNVEPTLAFISKVSSLLELDKTRPDPEFYLGIRDITRIADKKVEVNDLLELDTKGRDSILQGVKLKIKPPHNEKLVFKVNRTKLLEEVFLNPCERPLLETEKTKNVVVEFSSPNIAKPFHVGHLRSTIIGNFVSNLNQFLGHKVTRLNYLGDWGTQFGYLHLGVELKGFTPEKIQQKPIERLYEAYVAANAAGENDSTVHERAKSIFADLENGSFEGLAQWEQYRRFTVEELIKLYDRLNVHYDEYHWESMYGRSSVEAVVEQMKSTGVLQDETDGRLVAVVQGRRVPVVKSDGTTLYLTRDIAAFKDRFNRYNFDEMFYIVDNGQNDHFTALFSIVEQMKLSCSGRGKHIKFGRIKGMSTRKGTVVFLKDILDEAKDIMKEKQIQSKTTKIDISHADDASTDILGTTAVIINDLKQRRQSHYDFNWDHALQMSGDSGIKLQYTHSRLCSLEEKSGATPATSIDPSVLREPEALCLVIEMAKFPEAIARANEHHEACVLVNYLFSLCNATSKALNTLNIKRESNEAVQSQRQLLFNTARTVLRTGMEILGLKVLTKIFKKEIELEGWKQTTSRELQDYVNLINDTSIIKPTGLLNCEEGSGGLAWIFVFSTPENFRRREIIRNSWGNNAIFNYSTFETIHRDLKGKYLGPILKNFNTKMIFLMGKSRENNSYFEKRLQEENDLYDDILLDDFIDHWQNLSIKSLFMLKWAASNTSCIKNYKYVVKVDDNIFVNLPNLLHVLAGGTIPLYSDLKYFYDLNTIEVTKPSNRLPVFSNIILGDVWNLVFPIRKPDFKYYCPTYMFDELFYPPFHSGYLYVISQTLAKKLLDAANHTPIFHLEDTYVTGILAREAKIHRTRHHLFTINKLKSVCALKGILVEDGHDPEDFYETVATLSISNEKCSTMNENVVKYLYRAIFYFF